MTVYSCVSVCDVDAPLDFGQSSLFHHPFGNHGMFNQRFTRAMSNDDSSISLTTYRVQLMLDTLSYNNNNWFRLAGRLYKPAHHQAHRSMFRDSNHACRGIERRRTALSQNGKTGILATCPHNMSTWLSELRWRSCALKGAAYFREMGENHQPPIHLANRQPKTIQRRYNHSVGHLALTFSVSPARATISFARLAASFQMASSSMVVSVPPLTTIFPSTTTISTSLPVAE